MAKQYLSTSQAAKLLKIHPDTLRKRVKANKIAASYDANGHLQFDPALIAKLAPQETVNRTKAIVVLDESSSMGGHERNMQDCLQRQIDSFKASADAKNEFDFGSITFANRVMPFTGFKSIDKATAPFINTHGMTALYDAMAAGLRVIENEMKTDKTTAYLLLVITDGGENASDEFRLSMGGTEKLQKLLKGLVDTDRVTVAVNCPPGTESFFSHSLGIAPGNVLGWETTTQGIATLARASVGATVNYSAARSVGITSSSTYYAGLKGDANQIAVDLNKKLTEVTKQVSVERVGKQVVTIRNFADKNFGGYAKGSIFYELTKKETVQPYKGIIVQDKATGRFFSGHDAAKQMLGIVPGAAGDIKVAPGTLGEFKVFIQSTSYNRKLQPNTAVVRLQ